jgi:hypothetical protein
MQAAVPATLLLAGLQSDSEEAFSKIKGFVRQIGARTREALVEAIGKALDTVTAKDAWGFFVRCGYRMLLVQ